MTDAPSDGKHANEAVILSAARTPTGKLLGSLASLKATQLGAVAIRAALERARVDGSRVDEVFMGQVVQAGAGQAPARQAAIGGGLPDTVGATAVNKVCGSGLKAVMLAASAIRAGDGQLYVSGGMESMSQAPFLFREGRTGVRYGNAQMADANLSDGLWCSFQDWHMGNAAELIADKFEVTRQEMDEFSLGSHRKAVDAIDNGRFEAEIVPVEVKGRKGSLTLVDTDEAPRRDTSLEALAKLPPAFKDDGRVTAGNAPGLNDGAAALVVASRELAGQLGRQPMARIVGYAQAAVEPLMIFYAPALVIPAVLEEVGWTMDDVDLIELNEAFAAQVLADARAIEAGGLAWDWDKVNVNGGAVALGHPIGASGARVLVTLLYALRDRNLKRGVASLCLGGGEAVALAVEME